MATFKEHCDDCIRELGEPFEHVHRWLDELYKTAGVDHRPFRHHAEGIEEVRKMWGDRAARAAEIHIKKDEYGRIPTKEEANLMYAALNRIFDKP